MNDVYVCVYVFKMNIHASLRWRGHVNETHARGRRRRQQRWRAASSIITTFANRVQQCGFQLNASERCVCVFFASLLTVCCRTYGRCVCVAYRFYTIFRRPRGAAVRPRIMLAHTYTGRRILVRSCVRVGTHQPASHARAQLFYLLWRTMPAISWRSQFQQQQQHKSYRADAASCTFGIPCN